MKHLLAVATLTLLCAAACRGPETAPDSTPEPVTAPTDAPAASGWDALTREERMEVMKHKVLPAMKAAFTAFDAEEFGAMNCATCHGASAKDKTFKMPNPALPKLPSDAAGFQKLAAEEPEAVKFMSETVVPQMAAMLGEKPFDPATHTGFGCFECHTAQK